MEAVEVEQPRAGIDNGKSSSERIIPITVLDCKHNNDENDNTSTSTTTVSVVPVPLSEASNKRLSVSPSPSATSEVSITSSSSPAIAAASITTSEAPTTTMTKSNNNNEVATTSKRHSLLVTLDDGSTTQTIGSVTKLKDKEDSGGGGGGCGTKSQGSPNLSIEEIGHDTLMREIQKTTGRSPSPQKEKVRIVPIKLSDGKIMQTDPEESMQIRTEFTNYTHQEFNSDAAESDTEIPRMDTNSGQQSSSGRPQKSTTSSPPPTSGASCTTAKEKTEVKTENLSSRIVPIKLLETGESIMPTFTTLENPQPPEWSTFSKLNKAKERHVPLNVEHDLPERGRERAKTSSSGMTSKEDSKSQKPQSRSSSAKKNTVRFDLNEERPEKTITERRSSSMETITRKTTSTSSSTTTPPAGKPPSMPRSSARETARANAAGYRWRPQSAERPASATPATVSPGTERQLQEIDRDINQIWKELQELEKLPNGSYVRQATAAAGSSRARTPPPPQPPRPNSANSNSQAVPIQPVKIKAGYIGASPKYHSEPVKSTITSTSKYSQQTPPASRKGGPPRTIWDMENTSPIPNMSLPQTSSAMASAASNGIHSSGGLTQMSITSPSKAKETASSSNNVKVVQGIADPRPEFKASVTSPLMQQQSRPPPPPIPPHLRPSTINMTTAKAPIARDESMHDLGDSKSPSLAGVNFHDFESPAGNGMFKGFPYIDGAPSRRRHSKSPTKDQSQNNLPSDSNNFSVYVDKSTQTQDSKSSSNNKDACTIL